MAYENLPRAKDFFDPAFVLEVEKRTATIPALSNADLALCLQDAYRNDCYYHMELREFLGAAIDESAKRLSTLP